MNETFRTNKKKIKNNFFKPFEDDLTSPKMYANLSSYVDPTQFRRCVEELWVSEKGKKIAKINMENRNKKTKNHKTRSTPFSVKKESVPSIMLATLGEAYRQNDPDVQNIINQFETPESQMHLADISKEDITRLLMKKNMSNKKKNRVLYLGIRPYIKSNFVKSPFF